MTAQQLLEDRRAAIARLARRHFVLRLELFGSVARGVDAPGSDVDLLVAFAPATPAERAERYFALLEALEELLDRPVDLIESDAITNPYVREAIDADRVLLYAA